jgi:SAM-dependent methyltransferase
MALRIPRWLRRTGLAVIGIAAVGAWVGRTVDLKDWVREQLAVPHGVSGWLAALTMPMAHKAFYGPAADLLHLELGDELVEVACGSGVFLDRHARHVKRLAGLDLSDIQVRLAQRRLADMIAAGSAEIVLGDAMALPWAGESFSAATCMGSLEYFPDPAGALREMWRVLRPGGRMVVSYGLDREAEDLAAETESWGIPNPSEEEARKVVEEAGFSLVSISYVSGDYPARFISGMKPE